MTSTLTFIGGPWDGKVINDDRLCRGYTVPLYAECGQCIRQIEYRRVGREMRMSHASSRLWQRYQDGKLCRRKDSVPTRRKEAGL